MITHRPLSFALVHDPAAELNALARGLRSAQVEERLLAVRALARVRSADAVALLLSALADPVAGVRAEAARALRDSRTTEAVPALAALLSDVDVEVRENAVDALDRVGAPHRPVWMRAWRRHVLGLGAVDDARVPELLERALADEAPSVRAAALAVLPRHGVRGVELVRAHLAARTGVAADEKRAPFTELKRALREALPDHRRAAVDALRVVYGVEAADTLAQALDDEEPGVRRAALEALAALDPARAVPELLVRLHDFDDRVAESAVEALGRARDALAPAEQDDVHRQLLVVAKRRGARLQAAAAGVLGAWGRVDAVATLCTLLREASEPVVIAAADALGRIGDARAVKPLLALLERPLASVDVLVAAARALGRSTDVRVIPVLVRRLFEEPRPAARAALEAALEAVCATLPPALRTGLASSDPGTCRAAIHAAVADARAAELLLRLAAGSPHPEVRRDAAAALAAQGHALDRLALAAASSPGSTPEAREMGRRLLAAG